MEKVKVGIIGTGNISPAYINGCRAFDILDLVACADMDVAKAMTVAKEHNIPKALSVDELLADPEIEFVINLTIPAVHADVSLKIIEAGKHPYSEKPLAVSREDGQKIIAAAKAKGVLVGCAPDTFLFGPHQACRKLIDDGSIGDPVAAIAFMMGHGPERWHPSPDFFYQVGGGPLFDMGPYYITCLVNLLGPVKKVAAITRASFPERVAADGHKIPVNVTTHVAGTLEFHSGAIATLINSFDIWKHQLPRMEVYGATGSLYVPDPNGYENKVLLYQEGQENWQQMELPHGDDWKRGIGTADMAYALRTGRTHRASGEMAYHVLDVMHCFDESSNSGQHVEVKSTCARPAALPVGLPARQLDS
jgi:predicted dehydrogenase